MSPSTSAAAPALLEEYLDGRDLLSKPRRRREVGIPSPAWLTLGQLYHPLLSELEERGGNSPNLYRWGYESGHRCSTIGDGHGSA